MQLIEWRDDFSIGLPGVDSDHRQLIADINALHERIEAGVDGDTIGVVLGGIQTDIAAHFALEEKDMTSLGYDQLSDHKADHERLLDDILDIIDDVCDGARYDPSVLSGRLSEWFGIHFRTHDARLHRWLVGQRNRVR